MANQFHHPFDKALKETFLHSSLIKRIGDFEIIESLPLMQIQPETLYVDSLYRVLDKTLNEVVILHIKFQSTNDNGMVSRMHRYLIALAEKYRSKIYQCMIYIVKEPVTMVNSMNYGAFEYSFTLINLNDIPFEDFISSNRIGDIIIARLGNLGERKQIEAVDMVLAKLKALSKRNIDLSRNYSLSLRHL